MSVVQNLLRKREGTENASYYNKVLSDFHCIHKNSPPVYEGEEEVRPLLSCSFARTLNNGHILGVTCDDGSLMIVNTEHLRGDSYPYHLENVNTDALFSVAWSDVAMRLVATSGNHNSVLFDVRENGSMTFVNKFKGHTCSVKTACFQPQSSNVFATGGRDGIICVWDARCNERNADGYLVPENRITNSHLGTRNGVHQNSINKQKTVPRITCVTFQDEMKLASCADTEPVIKIWDLRKTHQCMAKCTPAQKIRPPDADIQVGYSHMVMNSNGTRLFASCTNNKIYCYNITSFSSSNLEYTYIGHKCNSFYVKCCLSPDEKYLASTDSDEKIYFWKVNASKYPIVRLDDSYKGLSDISWCPADPLKLATTSDYAAPWIWSVFPKLPEDGPPGPGHNLDAKLPYKKCKRTIPLVSKLGRLAKETTEIPDVILPNVYLDGKFQTHVCTEFKPKTPKSKSLDNWLTTPQSPQEAISSPKSLAKGKLTVRNRVSPKTDRSPGMSSNSRGLKRKRLNMGPGNNYLTKYFKKSDENREG